MDYWWKNNEFEQVIKNLTIVFIAYLHNIQILHNEICDMLAYAI